VQATPEERRIKNLGEISLKLFNKKGAELMR